MPTMSQVIARVVDSKLEILTTVHGHLESDHAALKLEHSALALRQDELSARIGNLERTVAAAYASSSQDPAVLAERAAKLERIERELADSQRCLQAASDQLSASRAETYAKEKRLQEVEQQLASLQEQSNLLTQENRSLLARIVGGREDTSQRLEEVESSLRDETAAHAKLRAAHLDSEKAHDLSMIEAANARSETAEKLLADVRAALRDRDATIRSYRKQRALEHSRAAKGKKAGVTDLEKEFAFERPMQSARRKRDARHYDLETASSTNEIVPAQEETSRKQITRLHD